MRRFALLLVCMLAGSPAPSRAVTPAPDGIATGPAIPAFVVDGGTQVKLSGSTRLTLDCDLRNYGAFLPAAGSNVVFVGYGMPGFISPTIAGVSSFSDLTMALRSNVLLANPVTVNGTLFLNSGWPFLGSFDLTVNALSGGSAASYVLTPDTLGRLVRTVSGSANTLFPVGYGTYDPVTIRTGAGSDVFRVAVLDAVPAGGLQPATALNHAYAVSHANAPGVNGNLTFGLTWNVYDQGPAFDRSFGQPASAWAVRYLNGLWVPQAGVRTYDNGASTFPAIDTLVTPNAGLWTLSGIANLLAVDPPGLSGAPGGVELEQNSPNPFVRETSIRYGLPKAGSVSLALYSLMGERVATLAQGMQEAGWHFATFDGSRLAGGIYFYRLEASGVVRSRKIIVLK